MKNIEIFDPAMCCSTGVCGPSVDPDLLRMSTVVERLKKEGANITRHNLKDNPQVYIDNQDINDRLMKEGINVLPITKINGEIVLSGKYPTNEQLAEWTQIVVK